LLPALEDSQLSKAAREAAGQLSHLDVNKFPLGFTTGGRCCLDRAIALLLVSHQALCAHTPATWNGLPSLWQIVWSDWLHAWLAGLKHQKHDLIGLTLAWMCDTHPCTQIYKFLAIFDCDALLRQGIEISIWLCADKKTDVAATILRMLYIKDLRGLQTTVDETLVKVQVRCQA